MAGSSGGELVGKCDGILFAAVDGGAGVLGTIPFSGSC